MTWAPSFCHQRLVRAKAASPASAHFGPCLLTPAADLRPEPLPSDDGYTHLCNVGVWDLPRNIILLKSKSLLVPVQFLRRTLGSWIKEDTKVLQKSPSHWQLTQWYPDVSYGWTCNCVLKRRGWKYVQKSAERHRFKMQCNGKMTRRTRFCFQFKMRLTLIGVLINWLCVGRCN